MNLHFRNAIAITLLTFAVSAKGGTPDFLTIERINSSPDLEGLVPRALEFSPGGQRLTFLRASPEDIDVLDLWEFDLSSGQAKPLLEAKTLKSREISEEEKARRERMRMNKGGITESHVSHDGAKIVVPSGNAVYLNQTGLGTRLLLTANAANIDLQFSPLDHYLSYVREQNLYVYDFARKRELAVSKRGKGALSFGTAEFVAQEEMGRFTGYWWSEDEKYIALTEVNEAPVTEIERYDIEADKVIVKKQRYPQAGSANAKVRLGVVELGKLGSGAPQVTWVQFPGQGGDFYLTDAKWTHDRKLAFQIQSRDQKHLDVWLFDPVTNKTKLILSEEDAHWVDLNADWKWLKNQKLLWASERSGHKHLYLYDLTGRGGVRQLTSGNWDVDEVKGVDESQGFVYFTSGRASPLECHFERVALSGGEPEAITKGEGFDQIEMSRDAKYFVRRFSRPLIPPTITLHRASGEQVAVLADNTVKEGHPLFPYRASLSTPEFGSFRGPSGDEIYYRLLRPHAFDPKKKYPLLVIGYGGPGVQLVRKSWGGRLELLAQVFAHEGYAVATIDGRGSSRRGKAFATALDHAMGTVEVEDQVAGVQHLISKQFIDPSRVGFYGWSYGGYLSLMLAAKAPQTFKANASGAPVTDFALYDTHYTERFLGNPKTELSVYKSAGVLTKKFSPSSHILILHGMADDNVLFTNSTLLFKKFQSENILYESIVYPGARHGVYGRDNQIHVGRTLLDFFARRLN